MGSGSSWIGGSAGAVDVMVRLRRVDGVVGEVGDVPVDEETVVEVGDVLVVVAVVVVVVVDDERRRRNAGARSVNDFRRDCLGRFSLLVLPGVAAVPVVPDPLPLDPGRVLILTGTGGTTAPLPVVDEVPPPRPVPGLA